MRILLLLPLLSFGYAAPPTSYDQRQEGELNVKVDLDNFVIVVARPSSGLDLLTGMASLFSDAKRAAAATHSEAKPEDDDSDEKSKNLEDVSLDKEPAETKPKEGATIVLVRTAAAEETDNEARSARNLKEASHAAEKSKSWLSSKYKFVDSVDEPQHLKLIGDAIENCGPGRSRDRFGICMQDRKDSVAGISK